MFQCILLINYRLSLENNLKKSLDYFSKINFGTKSEDNNHINLKGEKESLYLQQEISQF